VVPWPDYHSFRGSYGGYAFLLWDRRPLAPPHNLNGKLLSRLSSIFGRKVEPEDAFDVILCLLSAPSYSALFAEDLEDAPPHVPFPSHESVFVQGAELGARIRTLETFARPPDGPFLTAKIRTAPSGPFAQHRGGWKDGAFSLCADGSGCVDKVPREVWEFAVSGYDVLPRWLKHREGMVADFGAVTAVVDLCGRIAELLHLFAKADLVLAAGISAPLSK
jgi:Type ISP C-terminal specificity domain